MPNQNHLLMSEKGQRQTLSRSIGISALPPKADIAYDGGNVGFVPEPDIGALCGSCNDGCSGWRNGQGAWTGYLPDIAAGMTVCYMTFEFCVFCWKLSRRFR
jgi:hypothetical protein